MVWCFPSNRYVLFPFRCSRRVVPGPGHRAVRRKVENSPLLQPSCVVVAEWLRRWTRNPLGSPRAGSNPADYVSLCSSSPAVTFALRAPKLHFRPLWPLGKFSQVTHAAFCLPNFGKVRAESTRYAWHLLEGQLCYQHMFGAFWFLSRCPNSDTSTVSISQLGGTFQNAPCWVTLRSCFVIAWGLGRA